MGVIEIKTKKEITAPPVKWNPQNPKKPVVAAEAKTVKKSKKAADTEIKLA